MAPFAWGLLAGWLSSLALAGAALVYAQRRYHRLQRRARDAERHALQADRLAELGTLTGGLAHELKNPLSTVQLNLQLLREDLPADDPSYGRLVSIHKGFYDSVPITSVTSEKKVVDVKKYYNTDRLRPIYEFDGAPLFIMTSD